MENAFERVKETLQNMGLVIEQEDVAEQLVVVSGEEYGISNLIVDLEDPIIVLEQTILPATHLGAEPLRRLLQINRSTVHGAFAITEDGERVVFRDTLQLATLDDAELRASIEALSLALFENTDELISFASFVTA